MASTLFNLYDDDLYVGVSALGGDAPPYYGRIARVAVRHPHIRANWYVLSGSGAKPTQSGGGVWGWGGVAIDPSKQGDIYLATGNAVGGSMQQAVFAEDIIHLSGSMKEVLGAATPVFPPTGDEDYGSTPLVVAADGCRTKIAIAKSKKGVLVVDTIGEGGSMAVAQLIPMAGRGKGGAEFIGTTAFDPVNHLVLVTVSSAIAPYQAGLAAFRVGCSAPWLTPAFQATSLPDGSPIMLSGGLVSSPIVANGVAYFGAETQAGGSKVYAVLTQADDDLPAGSVVWASPLVSGVFDSQMPTVVNGKLFFSTISSAP